MYSQSTSTQGIHRKTKMRRRAATETETTEDAGSVSRADKREDSDNSNNEAGGVAVAEIEALGKPTTLGLRNKPAHNYAEDLDMVDAPLEDASDAFEEYHYSRTTSHNACTSAADGDCSHPPVTQISPRLSVRDSPTTLLWTFPRPYFTLARAHYYHHPRLIEQKRHHNRFHHTFTASLIHNIITAVATILLQSRCNEKILTTALVSCNNQLSR